MKDYSVWLFTRPLSYAMFSPPIATSSEGIHHLSHWGVLVNEISMIDLTVILSRSMRHNANEDIEFGVMYELFQENHVNNISINKHFGMNSIRNEWHMFSMQYVGKTTMTHETIKREGISFYINYSLEALQIINTHPDYRLFENNCQNFAKYLLETICPDASIPQTITEVLQGLQNIRNVTPLTAIPGAYPCSIASADNDSFETASGTYWFTTTETSWITAPDYSMMSVKENDDLSAMSHPINQDTSQRRSIATRGFAAVQRRLIGRTALINAGRKGDIKRVVFLLDLNIDTGIRDKSGKTALYHAAENGHGDVVELLLGRGADVDGKDKAGRTALHWASINGHRDVVELLLDRGADLAAKDNFSQQTALHLASENGQRDVVELLLGRGADLAAEDLSQNTALHLASYGGHRDVVELLRKWEKERDRGNHEA